MLNIDLHCHSTISDGVLTPEEVAMRAHGAGVDVWALTDHDEIDGVARARVQAEKLGMRHVGGVEISVTWAGQTVHIVGLQIDENNQALRDGLTATRCGRQTRGHAIADELAQVGIPNAFEGALKFAGNPDMMSRTHFARYIVELGVCDDIPAVFRNYLSEGKAGYILHAWARLADAVKWIQDAGGIAVVAHPGRYKFDDLTFGAFFDEFKQLGGTAIEVVTGSHTPEQYAVYAEVAKRYGFLGSRGSDFHGPLESRIDFGVLPPLPAGVKPVWHDWF